MRPCGASISTTRCTPWPRICCPFPTRFPRRIFPMPPRRDSWHRTRAWINAHEPGYDAFLNFEVSGGLRFSPMPTYLIQHLTRYTYDEPVSVCHHLAHLLPREAPLHAWR